ncbi:probable xyloglucan galactosyltransferase GT14 [Durio zibethinus]|uniref:Probable xyloglucan galactosyltransferase GT14 n=1 Tax=Durio zibethinus TaxID=66656 RepID=A0A6P5X3B7_DURZI|nr:probable xyloglucan galactosyltransferase GT14 [Durio zibethinus]
MCSYIENSGLGPQIESSDALDLWNRSWFSTNQFLLEVIFHNRMTKYKCLTNELTLVSAIFVPYYAGLDLRYLWGFNTFMRDSSGLDLVKWLAGKPELKRMQGEDRFLISGRIARDFRRQSNRKSDWGSNFRFLPESEKMSMLTIESGSWKYDFAVPYPTYFHPSTDTDDFQWQELMRIQNRPFLFSFVGAPRSRHKGLIRSEIIRQRQASNNLCNLVDCGSIGDKCDNPVNLMKLFQSSVFYLQPLRDSLTRRSTFDSILSSCIPLFFHSGSVFISPKKLRLGKARINQTLLQGSKDEELAMREEVIRLIPRIIYADSRSRFETVEDAFDLVKGIPKRIETLRKVILTEFVHLAIYFDHQSMQLPPCVLALSQQCGGTFSFQSQFMPSG